jgi:hypothetical protein
LASTTTNMLPKVMSTLPTANQLSSLLLLNLLLAMSDKDIAEIKFKDIRELLVRPNEFKMIEEGYKLTIFAFVAKFVSRIYGICKLNTWLSKKKGSTFFNLMTISDIAYTVAVLENRYEVWDKEYKKKKMSRVDWEKYKESDDYTIKKPKYTDQEGKKREYCNSGWSKDGIEFYNEVRKQWRDIAFKNNQKVWSCLEEAWAKYAEENDFGNIYSQKRTIQDISSNTPDYEEAQEEELPVDCFCVRDEIEDCPWKAKRGKDKDNDNGTDDEDGCSRPWKRARDGSQHLP